MNPYIKRIVGMLAILAGLLLMLYPWISNRWYEHHVDSSYEVYEEQIGNMQDETWEQYREAAENYNRELASSHVRITDPFTEDVVGNNINYLTVLSMDDQGTMGFLEIPKIQVKLPVYHGTSEEVLQRGIGHIQGTAFPVGGTGNRSVLSGHTGLNSAKMLTDLIEMEEGDIFFLQILNEILAYRVCDIQVIEPDCTDILAAEPGRDLVTLLTCTPYGVNSHRLVVTGERTPYSEELEETAVKEADSTGDTQWKRAYIRALLLGFFGAVGLILVVRTMRLLGSGWKSEHFRNRIRRRR